MIGIVSEDVAFLNEICCNIHEALEAAPVHYVAEKYSILLNNSNDVNLHALIIAEVPLAWNPVIMNTLTEEEKNMIQTLGSEWIINPEMF